MKNTHGFMSKSVIALALLGALPAAAGNATYPGALCTPISIAGSGTPTIYRSGRLLNLSSNAFEVVCPIQRNVTFPALTEDMTVTVNVVDGHGNDDICCVATVAQADGTPITDDDACTSGGLFDVPMPDNLSINLPSVFAGTNGYVSVRCRVPGTFPGAGGTTLSSVISSILVSE
ncbi:hypothetical protein [Pyxidicoccus sp. MSG2]|uniref:hypothetical protein n=1 Tax=Pyxidicoccus sp. MSG2 TaxID=2996790 RepID=UPI00227097F4|nr:hypothetical protein [Pyxidicoccus sp. MSG2]MCY1019298.1 hypothetical protein [Pyxidicoccus sp. MSG2]